MPRINASNKPLQYGSAEFQRIRRLAPKGVVSGKHINWAIWRNSVITRIQADFRAGLNLTENVVRARDIKFVKGARTIFGNWNKAFDESIEQLLAGIDPTVKLPYLKIKPTDPAGKHDVLERFIAIRNSGFEITPQTVLVSHTQLYVDSYKHFGSFLAAIDAFKKYENFIEVQKGKLSTFPQNPLDS